MAIESTSLGVYHLADNPNEYQPMRSNNFRFLVTGLERLIRVGSDERDVITNAQEVLDFSVVSFEVPHFQQDAIQIQRGNSTIKFAGKPSFGTTNLVINDFAGADGKSILEAWQALSYDVVNDTIQSSDKYKVDAYVLEYLPDGTLVRYWELKGCWVSSLSETGWNAASGDKKEITAQITYDKAIPHKGTDVGF